MKRQRKIGLFLAIAVLSTVLFGLFRASPTATAANPTTMSFQGKVVNANGTNVTDGTYSFLFKFYTVGSGGSAVWTETQSSVTVTAGVFQVNLGSSCSFFVANACNNNTPIDFNANPNLYLGITFNSDPAGEMNPRVQLQSVPFAYQADNASKLGGLAASNYVQLSPGIQQSGFITVNGSGTFGNGLAVTTGGASIGGTLAVTSSAAGSNAGLFVGAASATAPVVVLRDGATPLAGGDLLQWQNSGSTVLGTIQSDGVLNLSGSAGSVQYQNSITNLGDKLALYSSTVYGRYGFGIQANTLVAHIGATSAAFTVRVDPGSGQASSGTNLFSVSGLGNVSAVGTITGTTLNGTTGINTGAVAGTQRIDNSGNHVNAGNYTGIGAVTIQPAAATALTITGHAASTFSTDSGTLTLQGGSGTVSLGSSTTLTASGALAISAGGAAQNITLDGSTTGQVQIGGTSTGDILLGGGSASTGCTLSNAAGAFACTAGLTATSLTGVTALTVVAGGTAQNITIDGSTTGQVQIGGTSTGDILLGGGSASTGCTVTNSTGALACAAGLTATSLTGVTALAVASGGAAQNITLNGSTTGQVQIGGTSTGDILLGGGSASTGCTVTNASGNFACTATITAVTFNATTSYQANGTPGTTVAACTAAQYIGNGVAVTDGLITAGTCRNDATGISDARLKENVTSIAPSSALDTLNQLRPVSYEFNDLYHEVTGDEVQYGVQYGFIAQEVQQVMPGLVNAELYGQDGYYGIDYRAFHGLLTAAVQELSYKIDNVAINDGNQVITTELTSNGALVINSGPSGDVTIDSGVNSAYVKIGTEKATGVSISRAGVTTDIAGSLNVDEAADFNGPVTMNFATAQNLRVTSDLKIDNSSSTTPVDSAINITNSGGAGYTNIISTPSFTITGAGEVSAKSFISKDGSIQLLDAAGTNVVTIDNSGNANFKGNLNLASASLSGGLSVGGDVNIAGLSTFQKLATFIGKTVFRQDVQFDGHVTVAKDGAGYATLRAAENTVHVDFVDDYIEAPIVSAAITNGKFAAYTIDNVTTGGFDIKTQAPTLEDVAFSWTAVGVNAPQTAANTLPATP